jgi:predicted acetyltransferase
MSIDRPGKDLPVGDAASPTLRHVPPFEAEGLRFEVSRHFTSATGVPGYLFAVSDPDGTPVGEACAMIATDADAVARTGHLGCEVRPEFRKQGYPLRMGRALVPLARSHGLKDILFTCAPEHESMKEAFRALGAVELDELGAAAPDQPAVSRFLLKP